tara:strand:+ start:5092 stop:6042 length:951 start_codon:yes stop_codon:yes gene_type:complete
MILWKVIFGKINKIIILIFILSTIIFNQTLANSNKILLKVNNEIITSVDILNEIEYLSIINNKFKETEKKIQIEIARNSTVKQSIKKIELLKYKKNLQVDDELLESIILNYFSNLNIKSLSDLNKFLEGQSINIDYVKRKLTIETLWNQLIYSKFYKNVKINKDEIEKNISNKKILKEYLISEILMNFDNNKDFNSKIELVKKTINEKSFSDAALIYSISETSAKGGKLGWIKENALNNKIKSEINSINIGEITNPIVIPGGILILYKEDTRKVEKKININNEIKNIIQKKTNDQLKTMSTMYFNKIRKNILINEN